MKFTPYSFSKQNTFETCKLKFKFQYIDKIRTEFKMNAVLEKGSYIHLILEQLAKNNGVLPEIEYNFKHSTDEEIHNYKTIAHNFVYSELGYKYLDNTDDKFFGAEVEFGVKSENGIWSSTNYYDKKALFRGKIDHANKIGSTMYLLDWKSGRVSAFPAPLQLVMYAVWCFLKFPEIDTVNTAFVYLEHGKEKRYIFKRKHLRSLQEKIAEKLYNIEMETEFPKTESALCEYCQFRLSGDCTETSNEDFNDNLMKFAPKMKGN